MNVEFYLFGSLATLIWLLPLITRSVSAACRSSHISLRSGTSWVAGSWKKKISMNVCTENCNPPARGLTRFGVIKMSYIRPNTIKTKTKTKIFKAAFWSKFAKVTSVGPFFRPWFLFIFWKSNSESEIYCIFKATNF